MLGIQKQNLTNGVTMQTKTHKITFKNLQEDGTFEGYASVFNVVDYQKDIVLPGAFNMDSTIKMLWQHDAQKPIGVWEHIQQDAFGLYVKGRLLLDLNHAREAYTLLKAGAVDGLSIGFMPTKTHFDPVKKARIITSLDLHEISLVTFAANPKARVTSVKSQSIYNIANQINDRIQSLVDAFNLSYSLT